jgi:hypothetical protein
MAGKTKLDKDIEVVRDLRFTLRDVFNNVRKHGQTLEKLLADRNERIFGHYYYQKLPRWAHSELTGYFNAMWDMLQNEWTTGMYILKDGRMVDYSGKGKGFSVTPQELSEQAVYICSVWNDTEKEGYKIYSKHEVGFRKKEVETEA